VAKTQKNSGTPQGGEVKEWESLKSVGDVRRFLRWVILEAKDEKIDRQLAAVLGQLGCYVLKTLEISDLAARLEALERAMKGRGVFPPAPAAERNGAAGERTPETLI
jgi:hypothetical protein